jgi:hypothetical protein
MNADWVAAGATALGSIGTTGTLLLTYLLLRREAHRDAERDRTQRRHQASKVGAWYAENPATAERGLAPQWGAIVWNGSEMPVYQVAIDFFEHLEDDRLVYSHTVERELLAPTPAPVFVPPERILSAAGGTETEGPGRGLSGKYAVSIRFRDAAGVRWERNHQGFLTEVGPAAVAR